MAAHECALVAVEEVYWEEVHPSLHEAKLAVSRSLFAACRQTLLTQQQFDAHEQTLRAIAKSIAAQGFADVAWESSQWTETHLISHCGFTRSDEPTILLVDTDPSGGTRRRYAVKYIYLPMQREMSEMRSLCEYVFDEHSCVRNPASFEPGVCGQSVVCRRGNKAMNSGARSQSSCLLLILSNRHAFRHPRSMQPPLTNACARLPEGSTMLMYGSWDCWDWPGSGKKKGVTQPRLYSPSGAVDSELVSLLHRHADRLNDAEREAIPAYAAHRDALARDVDPRGVHR